MFGESSVYCSNCVIEKARPKTKDLMSVDVKDEGVEYRQTSGVDEREHTVG